MPTLMQQREITRLSYADFLRVFTWNQGEHIIAIGPTGCGKTTLLRNILPRRQFVVVFATKVRDSSLDKFKRDGYTIVRNWPPNKPWQFWREDPDRILLWPKTTGGLDSIRPDQYRVFKRALNGIFSQGGWTVVFDEEHYLTTELKLGDEIAMYHHQGRSSDLTIVDGSQRPAFLPVITYSSASHAFLWNTPEDIDLKRLSAIGGMKPRDLQVVMDGLGKHDFLYVSTRHNLPPIISRTER